MNTHSTGGFRADMRLVFSLSLLGGTLFWLATMGDTVFTGNLSIAEVLSSAAICLAASVLVTLLVRLLVTLTRPFDASLTRFRALGALLLTAAAAYPLLDLILTRRTWTFAFLAVSLLLVAILYPLLFVLWRHITAKGLWLLAALVSALFFNDVVESEGLLLRAGVDLFDLPTLVLYLVSIGTAAMSYLIVRFAQSTAEKSGPLPEVLLSLVGGLFLAVFAADAIDVHYENIFQVTIFFGFLATLYGVSCLHLTLPLRWSAPSLALVILAGSLLTIPIPDKPEWLSLNHPELAQKNRTIEEVFKLTALAEGEQRVAACRLHHVTDYPDGDFARRFMASVSLARHRPAPEDLATDPTRRILSPERPWNFLFITVDSLRYDRASYSGLTDGANTPTLTALAAESQRFHRAYPQGAWTSLSIPALMWSKMPSEVRFTPVYEDPRLNLYLKKELTKDVVVRRVYQVPLAEKGPTLAGVLTESGLETLAVVNDGNTGFFDPRLGLTTGFANVRYTGEDGQDRKAIDMALEALRKVAEKPFFMWVHLFDVHKCYKKPTNTAERNRWRNYDHRLSVADRNLGTLLAALEEAGLKDSTIVILTGDHGESFGELGVRGHGLGLNSASIHVPLLIRIPGLAPTDYERPVGLMDLAPTVMDLAGHGEAVPEVWAGTSLASMLAAGRDLDHPPVRVETWRNKLRQARKHLHRSAVIYETMKVSVLFNSLELGFYDLTSRDPAKEKALYPVLTPSGMTDEQLTMVKYLLNWKSRGVERACN